MSKKTAKQELRKVDQPHYNVWQTLHMALYSNKLYVDVAKRWKGFGILYVLLLFALASIPLSTRVIIDYAHYFDNEIIHPLQSLPPLYIQKGEVKLDKKIDSSKPYFVKNQQGKIVAIIDTTGATKEIDRKKYPDQSILITKNELHVSIKQPQLFFTHDRQTTATDLVQSFNKDDNEVFIGKDWVKTSGMFQLKWVPMLLVYPIIVMFFFVIYYSLFLILAFMGQVFAKVFFDMKLSYKQACRIFAVAATGQVYFFFLMMTTGNLFTGLGLLYVAILTVYFSYAVVSIKRGSNKMVLS